MNKNDFIKNYAVDRANTSSLKWDLLDVRYGDPDLISMWVADMEFKSPDSIREALAKRVEHGVFGYSFTPDSYYEAFFDWQKKRHNIHLEKEWIRFGTGVVNTLYALVNIFTEEGEGVLIQSPVYYPFHNAVNDNFRKLVRNELVNTNGKYTIDFEDMEKKIIEENVKMIIFCNPHNPAGRVWKLDELEKMLEICKKHNVLFVSDEIHQDIILGDNKFISALSVADEGYHDNLIVLTAASKTFNTACLLNSHIIIPNEEVRSTYDKENKRLNQTELSIMGQIATEAGYRGGEEWLDALLEVIETNYEYTRNAFHEQLPKSIVSDLEGTYLTWIDLREYFDPEKTKEVVQDKGRVACDFGEWFSDQCKGFIRLNMGTTPEIVEKAVTSIIAAVKNQ